MFCFAAFWLLAVSELLRSSAILTKSEIPGSDFVTLVPALGWSVLIQWIRTTPGTYKIERKVIRSERWKQIFLYPPFFALAIRPLGAINYTTAYWTWTLTIVVYLLPVLLLIREFRDNAAIIALSAPACPAFHLLMVSAQTTALALLVLF